MTSGYQAWSNFNRYTWSKFSRYGHAGFTAASGRIAVDHWSALLSCTLEFQKAFLAALPKR